MWGFIETLKSNLDDAAGLSKSAAVHLHEGAPSYERDGTVLPSTVVEAEATPSQVEAIELREASAVAQDEVPATSSEIIDERGLEETAEGGRQPANDSSEGVAGNPDPNASGEGPAVVASAQRVDPLTADKPPLSPDPPEADKCSGTGLATPPQPSESAAPPKKADVKTDVRPASPFAHTKPLVHVHVAPVVKPPVTGPPTAVAHQVRTASVCHDAELAELRASLEAERAVSAQLRSEGQSIAHQAGVDREKHRTALAERARLEGEITALKRTVEAQAERLAMSDERMHTQDAIIRKLESDMSSLERTLTERLDASAAMARAAEAQQQRDTEAATQVEGLHAALRDAESRHAAALASAASERDALLLQVRRQALLSEQRAAGLEREIAAMERRADEAEQRALEASGGLLDAATEWGARVRQLEGQGEAAAARERAHRAEMEQMAAAVVAAQREITTLRDATQCSSTDAARAHAAAGDLRQQAEQAHARAAAAEAALAARDADAQTALQAHSAEVARLQRELAEARALARATTIVAPPLIAASAPTAGAAPVGVGLVASVALGGTAVPGTRVEKELARVTAQVNAERAGRAEAEAALAKLRLAHDVLLQMHGQLLEEFEAAAAVPDSACPAADATGPKTAPAA